MPAGSGDMLAWYQDKPVEVLNMPTGSGEISSKIDLVNAPLGTWFNKQSMFRPIVYDVIKE